MVISFFVFFEKKKKKRHKINKTTLDSKKRKSYIESSGFNNETRAGELLEGSSKIRRKIARIYIEKNTQQKDILLVASFFFSLSLRFIETFGFVRRKRIANKTRFEYSHLLASCVEALVCRTAVSCVDVFGEEVL